MNGNPNYNHTIYASFAGYVVQAVVNNFVPLLFMTFQSTYGISLDRITMLVTFNFGIQLIVDLASVKFLDMIGYRSAVVMAHVFSAAGLVLLTILPDVMNDAFTGILLSVMIYAVGGGLIEVLISPIVEACPTGHKESVMSLLHSFYCWGHVGVVLFSTLFFAFAGISNWRILARLWAILPIVNGIVFTRVPILGVIKDGQKGMTVGELLKNGFFWIMLLLMMCAGACEQGISQWASTFAEKGLGVSKTIGDLTGPLIFAALMGTSRVLYGKYGEKIRLESAMIFCGALCLVSYLLASLSGSAVLGLLGCALCGLSVGILWPGSFSMASAGLPLGGTALFAFLALAGDVGCCFGPTFVGLVSDACGENLQKGILAGSVFPVLLLTGLGLKKLSDKNKSKEQIY